MTASNKITIVGNLATVEEEIRAAVRLLESIESVAVIAPTRNQVDRHKKLFPNEWLRNGPKGLINLVDEQGLILLYPNERVCAGLAEQIDDGFTGEIVVVMPKRPSESVVAWMKEHGAAGIGPISVPPAVKKALSWLCHNVNHNNGLIADHEKALTVRTLEALCSRGCDLSPEELWAYAQNNGFTPDEAVELRDYCRGVNAGKNFVLRDEVAPSRSEIDDWFA